MIKYEYKVYSIDYSIWTGKADEDYLEIINNYGLEGWRFIDFSPQHLMPKGEKGTDLIFERPIEEI